MGSQHRSFLDAVIDVLSTQVGGIRGSGNVISREFDLRDFTGIRASVFDLEITRGDKYSVVVRADDNLFDVIAVYKRGETLRLRTDRHTWLLGPYTLEARITMPDLREIELNGSAFANVSGFERPGELRVLLSGASELHGTLNAEEIDVNVSGASKARLEGQIACVTIEGSGASTIDFANLTSQTAELTLSGASRARLLVTERITMAELSGASRLRYAGNPMLDDVRISGASRVDRADQAGETSS